MRQLWHKYRCATYSTNRSVSHMKPCCKTQHHHRLHHQQQEQQRDQSSCSRCCFYNFSKTYPVLHAPLITSYKLVFLFFWTLVFFPYYVLPYMTCAVHDFVRKCSSVKHLPGIKWNHLLRGRVRFFALITRTIRYDMRPLWFGTCSTSVVC